VAGPLLVWRFGPAAATPVLVLVAALLVGAAGAVAAAAVAGLLLVRRQHGLGWAALIGTVTLALAVQLWAVPAALATVRPAPPARARIRVALERAETAVLLGCGVTALATFDAYGLAFAVVR
jgi:hypothetical protein